MFDHAHHVRSRTPCSITHIIYYFYITVRTEVSEVQTDVSEVQTDVSEVQTDDTIHRTRAIYYIKKHAKNIKKSKYHRIVTPEAFRLVYLKKTTGSNYAHVVQVLWTNGGAPPSSDASTECNTAAI